MVQGVHFYECRCAAPPCIYNVVLRKEKKNIAQEGNYYHTGSRKKKNS